MLELEFKQHNQIKTKCLKRIVKNILPNYKSQKMHIYCKKCKKHTSNTFLKKLILISKCAICLTERYFNHEIEFDLGTELEIYLQFFTD